MTYSEHLNTQLDTIFQCAPGPHEIRILRQKYQIIFDGKPKDGYHDKGFSIGAPKTTQEAISLVNAHFYNGIRPNNCYIVLNRVSDDYQIATKRGKIGDCWYPAMGYILTKESDIRGYCALAIDLDRNNKTNQEGEKQVASYGELRHLKMVADMVCADLARFGLRHNYCLMSGNGFQIVYFFELQMDVKETKGVIKNILDGLHENYLEHDVDIDTSLNDPPQIVRLAGTWNEKNWKTNTDEQRIVRQSQLVGETVLEVAPYANIKQLEASLLNSAERHRQWNKKQTVGTKKSVSASSLSQPSALSQAAKAPNIALQNDERNEWINNQLRAGGRKLLIRVLEETHQVIQISGESGGKIQITCPYHNDKTPSAWIQESDNGIPMIHCSGSTCPLRGNSKTALGVLLDDGWNFRDACQDLFGEVPPIQCKYCGKEIIFQEESKRPLNLDHSLHACDEYQKQHKQKMSPEQRKANGDNRPTILLQGDLEIKTREIIAWLHANNTTPDIFTRGREIVRLVKVEGENKRSRQTVIERMDGKKLRAFLNERIRFEKEIKKKDEVLLVTADLPLSAADNILARSSWPFPELMEIIRHPTLDHAGKLILMDGYNPSMQAWVDLGGFNVEVSEKPAHYEVEMAKNFIINDLLKDFPFTDQASLANTIGLSILPFVRHLIDGCTPLHLITAPVPGTGKGLLVEILSKIATGKMPTNLTEGRCEEEWRKRITAVLDQSPAVISIDNLMHALDSGTLSSALTSKIWSDRRLGSSTLITVRNNAVWVATGNNPQLSMEVARRCVWISLDPKLERPWQRENFKHHPLRKWVKEQRIPLVKSFLTLAQSWVNAGMPKAETRMGSFEEWAEIIGGILAATDIPGFLSNSQELYLRADSEMQEWRAFLEIWWEYRAERAVATRELHSLALNNGLLPTILGDKNKTSQSIRLGIALKSIQNRVISCWQVEEYRADTHSHSNMWRLVKVENDNHQ